MSNTIEATIGLNVGPLQTGFAEADRLSRTYSNRISGNLGNIAFKGERKVSRNLADFTQILASGGSAADLMTAAVYRLGGSIKGGLGAAVGLSVGYVLYEGLKKAREESEALSEALAKVNQSSGPAEFNTVETLTSKLAGIREKREALIKNQKGYGAFDAVNDADLSLTDLADPQQAAGKAMGNWSRAQQRRAKEAAESFAAERKALSDIAAKYRTVTDIEEERTHGSERQAAIMKETADFNEKYGPLIQSGPTQNPEAAAELKRAHALDLEAIGKKFDLKKQEEEAENRILNLHASSLTKEEQSLAALRERINLLKTRLAGPGSNESKTEIGTQLHSLENQELQKRYETRFDGPALYTPEKGQQARFREWARNQTPSSPNAYLTHPDAYKRSPDAYGGPDDEWMPNGQPYRSRLGELSKHMPALGSMAPFAGSDSFNQSFHPKNGKTDDTTKAGNDPVVGKLDQILSEIQKWGN